jgi:PGF-pre-PGF domain-containing protein
MNETGTEKTNISIIVNDTTALTISYPTNTSYATSITALNYTYIEANTGHCWYTNDSGASNSSLVAMGTNFTRMNTSEASNTWTVYCNDTAGNENSATVTFVKDLTNPVITHECSPSSVTISAGITCTCSATDNIDSGPTVNYTASPDTTVLGEFTTTCTATDAAGNIATDPIIYTVYSGSGTSSGTGGSSTQTGRESKTWSEISPGSTETMQNLDDVDAIDQISLSVKEKATNVKLTVSKHDSKPTAVSKEKAGKVYSYIEIQSQNLGTKLKKADISIKVPTSWIQTNGLQTNDVALFRFDGAEWKELETYYTKTEGGYVYYDTSTTSFSYFAIGSKIDAGEEVMSTEPQKPVSSPPTTTQTQPEGGSNLVWFLVIPAIAVILNQLRNN